MITKEEITIKVPSEVAEAYRNATEGEREQLQLKIAAIMQSQLITDRQEAIARLRNTMDKASLEAQERGLIPIFCEAAHYFNPSQPPLTKGRCRRRWGSLYASS
ncbi:hypothetical protein NIES4106_24510 [Fischerella sp. NIES-4106]|nr:hypothetical protein NIES4106_24510 [Fischerella sp. NIES-4106]